MLISGVKREKITRFCLNLVGRWKDAVEKWRASSLMAAQPNDHCDYYSCVYMSWFAWVSFWLSRVCLDATLHPFSFQTHLMTSFPKRPKRKAVNFLSNVVLTAGKRPLFGVSSKTTKARPDTAAQHKMRRWRFKCRTCLQIAARWTKTSDDPCSRRWKDVLSRR